MVGETITNVWDALIALNKLVDTPFLDRLKACGCPAESVDFVMCTHLHVDHVGWNTKLENGRWVPTFPNAKYLFAKREYAHWESERKSQGEGKVNDGSFDDSVLPVVEAAVARWSYPLQLHGEIGLDREVVDELVR